MKSNENQIETLSFLNREIGKKETFDVIYVCL